MSKTGKGGYAFKWTDEEWAVLEPLSEADRFELVMSAVMTGRGLMAEARRRGLLPDAAAAK